jgi:hypothetical protein
MSDQISIDKAICAAAELYAESAQWPRGSDDLNNVDAFKERLRLMLDPPTVIPGMPAWVCDADDGWSLGVISEDGTAVRFHDHSGYEIDASTDFHYWTPSTEIAPKDAIGCCVHKDGTVSWWTQENEIKAKRENCAAYYTMDQMQRWENETAHRF